MPENPRTVQEYIDAAPTAAARDALLRLRHIILEEVPDAQEVISYGLAGFSERGPFIWIGAFKNHCSLFAATTTGKFADQLEGFRLSKGTIQFKPEQPIPEPIVREIVRARYAEHVAKKGPRKRPASN